MFSQFLILEVSLGVIFRCYTTFTLCYSLSQRHGRWRSHSTYTKILNFFTPPSFQTVYLLNLIYLCRHMENPSLPIVCMSRFWNPSQYKNRALFKQNFSPLQPKLASMQQALSFLLYISDLEKQLIHLRKKIAVLTADPINIKCLLKYIHEKKKTFCSNDFSKNQGEKCFKVFC